MNKTFLALGFSIFLWLTVTGAETATGSVGEPTKAETVEFIESKLAHTVTSDDSVTEYSFDFRECLLIAKLWSYTNPKARYSDGRRALYYQNQIEVPLGVLDPSRVKAQRNEVDLIVRGDKRILKVTSSGTQSLVAAVRGNPMEKYEDEVRDYVSFYTVGEREADQLVRAFNHLIQLCGGKSELF